MRIDADWVRAGGGAIGLILVETVPYRDAETGTERWSYYAPTEAYGLRHQDIAGAPEDLARLLTDALLPHAAEMAADLRAMADEIEVWAEAARGVEWHRDGGYWRASLGDSRALVHWLSAAGCWGWWVGTGGQFRKAGVADDLPDAKKSAGQALLSEAKTAGSDPSGSALSDAGGGETAD